MTANRRRASILDTVRVLTRVLLPTLASGVIKRRPRMVNLAARLNADAPGVALLHRLRARYGSGPLPLRLPVRSVAVVLDPQSAEILLEGTPDPFSAATRDKVAALSYFQPNGVLISTGVERTARRAINEHVLDAQKPLHHLHDAFREKIEQEVGELLADVDRTATLTWDGFARCWWRIVRRITLGDAARDDERTTDLLGSLRARANWPYLARKDERIRAAMQARLQSYVDKPEPGCLAGLVAAMPDDPSLDPTGQIPHWLFAFDAGGMTSMRTLALLATHAEYAGKARAEVDPALPLLRACVLDTVRLWPTTPLILRESTAPSEWPTGVLPPGTTFLIVAPFLHRDSTRLPYADAFCPEIWLDGRADADPALVPFSRGPAGCPGRNVVLFATTTLLAALLRRHDVILTKPSGLDPAKPLPATVTNFAMRFTARRSGYPATCA